MGMSRRSVHPVKSSELHSASFNFRFRMASRWFDDLCDDDFFTRPTRFRLLEADPWGSLERLDHDLGRSDIFSDFASKAASLRHRVEQDRKSRQSPVKKGPSRRGSRVSDGIASPTPSSVNSAFTYGETPPAHPQGHVTFPASSCSNISECSQKSNDSITTEKSVNHCSESEQLPGGGQACKAESTQSWVDRNTSGCIVGEGVLTESSKTETRPGSFQEYSKQQCSYVETGSAPQNTFHSLISQEIISQSSSSKSKIKHSSPIGLTTGTTVGGKPFRAPPNRSLFYDELDSTLGTGGSRLTRRRTPLDRLIGLVDQVAHHDRLFQTEMDHFLKVQPKVSSQPSTPSTRNDAARVKTNEDLKKENEALKEENCRLEQVLQEVTAVNKRWQRYNTDRRMYVQKLLATIQDLQEQMNDRAESAISRASAAASRTDCGGVSSSEVDELRQQTQLLLLQIKSHKEDWQAEHQERCKVLQEKNELEGEVARLKKELDILQHQTKKRCSSCLETLPNQQTHIASQDFYPRSSYETSFQVPYASEDTHSDASTAIIGDQSSSTCEDGTFTDWNSFGINKNSSDSQSLYLGYPSAGLASVIGFSAMSHPEPNQRLSMNANEPRHLAEQKKEATLICPNCARAFPPSRRRCFVDHIDFCHNTDETEGNTA